MWNFLGTLGEYLSWLYRGREWATWELIAIAVVLLVPPLWIFKRLRRRPVRRARGSHFLDGTSVIGVKLADQPRSRHGSGDSRKAGSMHPAGRPEKQEKAGKKARGWKKAVEQIKHKPTERKLEAELAELTAAYEQPREEAGGSGQTAEPAAQTAASPAATDKHVHHESAETGQPQANPEQKIAERTAANEKLHQEAADSSQAKEPLEQELAKQTSVNEQLRKEVAEIKQAEERLEQRVAKLTAANEQLKQEVAGGAGRARKDDAYEQRHRLVEGVDQKLCGKCGQWKTEGEFHKKASSRDGLANQCKQCKAEAARQRRERRNAAKD